MKRAPISEESAAESGYAKACADKPATATASAGCQQALSEPSTAEPSASEESDESDPFEVESSGRPSVADGGMVAAPRSDTSHDEDDGNDDGAHADADEIESKNEFEIQAEVEGEDEGEAEDCQLALTSCKAHLQEAVERPLASAPSARCKALEIDGIKAREPLLHRLLCRILDKRRRRSL